MTRMKSVVPSSTLDQLSTPGGRIAVALVLVVIAVIASVLHITWSERIATAGIGLLIMLVGSRRRL